MWGWRAWVSGISSCRGGDPLILFYHYYYYYYFFIIAPNHQYKI